MAPRIRSLHPGQWRDQDFVECSFGARLLALALRNEADDQGVFEWKPKQIKMNVFPADSVDIDALLGELVQFNIIRAYETAGRHLGAIRNFRRYQRPKTPNAVHPVTDEILEYVGLIGSKSGNHAPSSSVISEIDDDEGELIPENGEQRKEEGGRRKDEGGNKKTSAVASQPAPDASPEFIRLPTNLFQSKGEEVPFSEKFVEDFQALYPALDLREQLRKMRAWLLANPDLRKTRKGMTRFVNNWLGRQQNAGATRETPNGGRNGSSTSTGIRSGAGTAHQRHLEGLALLVDEEDGRSEIVSGPGPAERRLATNG